MSYAIQPEIFCENCLKCGQRPVTDQTKKGWEIKCENKSCNNKVEGTFIDFDTWNKINKANIELKPDSKFSKSA